MLTSYLPLRTSSLLCAAVLGLTITSCGDLDSGIDSSTYNPREPSPTIDTTRPDLEIIDDYTAVLVEIGSPCIDNVASELLGTTDYCNVCLNGPVRMNPFMPELTLGYRGLGSGMDAYHRALLCSSQTDIGDIFLEE